jgi:hypothetical protein
MQPDSSWASGRGEPQPWLRKEQSDDRSHGEGAASSIREFTQKQIGPPEGGPLFLAEARSPDAEARASPQTPAHRLPASQR